MKYKAPKLLFWLEQILPTDLHHLIGDLEEDYHRNCNLRSTAQAAVSLYIQVLRFLPWLLFYALKWKLFMITHYLKTALRVTRKYPTFSFINIIGLAASMAVCLLIILFLVDQKSYDRFHENSGRIYRVISNFKSPSSNEAQLYATTPANLADILESSLPEVERAVKIRKGYRGEIKYGDRYLALNGLYAGPEFLDVFDFELIKGNPETALNTPGSIILTPQSAETLFGNEDPMGREIISLGDRVMTVTGIIDNDVRSHFQFESLVSYSTLTGSPAVRENLGKWTNSIYDSYTYLLLKNDKVDKLQPQLAKIIESNFVDPAGESVIKEFQLQPLTGITLSSEKSNEVGIVLPEVIAWFMIGFGVIIILIACFNYISLTIARAVNRSKEVGVRKVLGSHRSGILKQFLTEAILISVFALVFSLIILIWLLPHFNNLFVINFTNSQIVIDLFSDFRIYGIFLGFSIIVGLIAGLYPSWYFTHYEPVRVLKGAAGGDRSRLALRKVITVLQFTISIIFIITSLVLVQQFRFMASVDYGFDEEHIINVALQDISYDKFHQRMESVPEIEIMAASSKIPGLGSISGADLSITPDIPPVRAHYFQVDQNYIQTMGLDLLGGRNFDPNRASDSTNAIILGRSAVEETGIGSISEAIGRSVYVNDNTYTIIGVIDDFISNDPTQIGDPIVLRYHTNQEYYAVIKVRPGQSENFLAKLSQQWGDLGSQFTLKYEIFDDQLKKSPTLIIFGDFSKVFGFITFFCVLISCLGLLGMAIYTAENRLKEIGVRKVLGASQNQIIVLLSREYLILILAAVIVGTPIAWAINSFWLSNLSNSISLAPFIFIVGITGTAALALLTICSQTIRAARTNVVDNLKSE